MIHDDTLLAKQVDDNTGVRSKTHYVVFFISDGAPRVDGGTTTVMEDRRQILSTVDSIMSLQNVNRTYVNSITLHTAYYYLEIKFHTPINFDNRKIIGLRPQQYDVTLVSSNEKQDCYEANVTEITIKGDADTLRAYVLETTPIIDDDRFMRVADKPVSAFETVRFSDEDFIEH